MSLCDGCIHDDVCGLEDNHEEGIVSCADRMPKDVIDKIKAEIKTKYDSIPWRNTDYDDGWIEALEWVYDDVIDKYKEGSGK